ncbi:hypothetical protein Tco_0097784 [Tanacetum coccineum]
MADDDVDNDRVEQLENSLKRLEETVQNSLQQITQTIATLTTHENKDQPIHGDSRRPNRGCRNGRPQKQHIEQHNYGGEDSDVEDEFEDGWNGERRFGHRGAREFDYHQRAKDVLTFHGLMNFRIAKVAIGLLWGGVVWESDGFVVGNSRRGEESDG